MKVGTSFSASTVRDLYLYIYWTNLSGNHIVTVTFYSPDGQLYEQRLIPVTTSAQSVSPRMVPGVERSVNVQSTRNFAQYNVSTVQLPVAGTWITRHRLLGTWRADVLLDQASTPIVSSTFTIMN
ncbi:MAG TPA: hypothetical protein VLY45_00730 [Nitrospiria bacterium]|nr:hypothetical protein [Nitrospiria bacterium]